MATTARMKKKLETWKPSRLSVSDACFEDHEIHTLTVDFLTGWREYMRFKDRLSFGWRLQ